MMGNNSDKFILEISAKIEKDSKTLVNELQQELKKVEKECQLDLTFNDEKTKQYLEKLKKAINDISSELNNAKLEANSSSFSKFVNVLKEGAQYSKTIADSLNKASKIRVNLDNLQKQANAQAKKQTNTSPQNIKTNKDIVSLEFKDLNKQLKNAEKEINKITKNTKLKKELANIQNILNNPFKNSNVDFNSDKAVQKYISNVTKTINTLQANIDKAKIGQGIDIQDYVKNSFGKYDASLDNLRNKSSMNDYANMYNKLEQHIKSYENELTKVANSTDELVDISGIIKYESEIENLISILKNFNGNTVQILPNDSDFKSAKEYLKNLIKKEVGKDAIIDFKIDENASKGILKVTANVQNAKDNITKLAYSYNDANKAVEKLTTSNKELANVTKKAEASFTGSVSEMMKFATAHIGMEDFIQKFREGLTLVKDMDTALTEMNKVSNESFFSLQKYASTTFDTASDIGTTGLNLQNSTADWMRLGKSMQDASRLAEDTNVLFNVSEFNSIDEATESMVSMTQAYQELNSKDIVDKLNLTGNNYSIATNELAQSLQKSSSALKTAKNSFDEAIALTVAGNSVVQNPDMVAAGVRTISLRMAGTEVAKSELESLGEETDDFLTKSKLNDTLEKLTSIDERGGISLLDDKGNYRSTAKVLMDLADRWEEIGKQDVKDGQNRQSALLEALAGKNRANILASILNDKDLLKNVYEDVSTNYQGSALEENEKQMESIEGHLTELKNKWQDFWSSDINRKFVTDLLDLAQGVIDLTNALGGAKTVVPLFLAAWSQKKFGIITDLLTGMVTSLREIISLGNSPTLTSLFDKFGNKTSNLLDVDKWKGIINQPIDNNKPNDTLDDLSNLTMVDLETGEVTDFTGNVVGEVVGEMADNLVDGKNKDKVGDAASDLISGGFLHSIKNSGVKSTLLAVGKNLVGFLTTPLGAGIAIAGVTLGAKALYDNYIEGLEEAAERAENAADDYKNVFEDLSKFKADIPSIAEEYDALKDGVSSTGENLSLTNDEFARYNEITNQIASKFPSLISGYNSTGNAIINMKDSIEELNKAYDVEAQKKARESILNSPLEDQDSAISLEHDNTKKLMSFYGDLNASVKGYAHDNLSNLLNDSIDNSSIDKNIKNSISKYIEKINDTGTLDFKDGSYKQLNDIYKSFAFNDEDYETFRKSLQLQVDKGDTNSKMAQIVLDEFDSRIADFSQEYEEKLSRMVTFAQSKSKYYKLEDFQRTAFDSLIMNLSESDYDKYSTEEGMNDLLRSFVEYSSENEYVINSLRNIDDLYGENLTLSQVKEKISELKKKAAKGIGVTQKSISDQYNLDEYETEYDNITTDIVAEIKKASENVNKTKGVDFKNITKELLSENFSPSELEKINNDLDNRQTLLINTWQNGLYKYYDNWKDYVIDFIDTISEFSPTYHGENKSFSQLTENNSSYSSTLAELNNLGNDNVKITEEMASKLKSYGDEFDEFIKLDGDDYIISNTKAVKEQIKALEEKNSIDAKNSKETARRQYTEITNSLVDMTSQLYETVKAEGHLDESILNNIDSSEEQLRIIQQNIQKYAQLEQQLLGTSNAFDVYNAAVEYDNSNDSYSKTSQMLDTLKSAFKTGKYGEASFDAALQGVLSDEKYEDLMNIDDISKRIETAKKLYNDAKTYFEKDNDGNSKISSLEKFITSAQNKGLFEGKGLKNFNVKEGVTLEQLSEQMGYSKELTYSILEEIEKYNADINGNIFEGFMTSTFDKNFSDLESKNEEIINLNKKKEKSIIALSKVTDKESEEYKTLTKQIDEYTTAIHDAQNSQVAFSKDNTTNVRSFINIEKQIEQTSANLEMYEKKLADLEKEPSSNKNKIKEIKVNIEEARTKLGELLNKKEKLGEPVEIQLTTAKDDIQKQINDLENQKRSIIFEATGLDSTLMDSSQLTRTISILPKIDQEEIKSIDEKLIAYKSELDSINIKLGINTDEESASEYQTHVDKIKADKQMLNEDCEFDVKAKTGNAVKNLKKATSEADKLKARLNNLRNASVNVTTTFFNNGSYALGNNNTTSNKKKNALIKSENIKKSKKDSIKEDFEARLNKSITDPLYLKNYVLGNAFSIGSNNSRYKSGKTLVGEFGAETIVNPYSGEYYVVGRNGAELVDIPKDAIVFNHRQTEQLNKNNRINSRGKLISDASSMMKSFSHALGTYGEARSGNVYIETGSNNNSKNSSSSKSSKNNSSSDDAKSILEDLFDWIEIRLERLSNTTQKWITLAENAISKSVQQSHYTSAINNTATQLSQNQTAKDKYLAQANALIKKSGIKNASAYAKKVRDGSLSIQSISNEKIKDFVTSYKEMYDKAVECNNAVMDLTGELQDLAETLYNLPIEHAEKKVEKYSDKMNVLSAKYENYRAYYTQNPNLDEQTKLQKSIKNAYASAYTETKSNLKTAKSKINSVSDSALKGLSSAQKKKIVANVNAGNEINISNAYSATLKKALANYNAALEANRVASNESAKASAEYTKVLRENTNAKYENISAYYEQNRSLNEARLSKFDAQLEYRKAMGYSAVSTHSDGQKGVYDQIIKNNENILKQLRTERSNYNEKTLTKQFEDGKLSREDYFALMSHAQELDEQIYSTITAIEEAEDEIYNLNITRLDYIIDGVSRAMEKFQNIISLKEARDEDIDESYYVSQNEGLTSQIESLNEKREAILEEMKDQNVKSERYQELAAELQSTENDIYSKLVEIEENKDVIMENRFKKMNESIDDINTVIDDIEHLRDLLSDDELIDENGVFTDSGLAEIALVGELIDSNTQKITDYRHALEKLEENFTNGNLSPEEYEEQSRVFIEGIQNAVKSIEDYKDVLIDLYSEQLKIENDALQENIENRKKALQAKKSYYDYDKTLKSANKDIVSLKNQIAALEGVGNASAKAEVERLKAQLSEAESELEDTKYEHTVELQLSGYDEMSASADKILEDLLEDLKTNAQLQEEVVSNMLDNIVDQYDIAYGKIRETISSTAVGDNTSGSLATSGQDFSNSVNTSASNRNTSYGSIETSKIYSGNENTASIEKSVNNHVNETNGKVNTITPNLDSISIVAGSSKTVSCKIQPSDATNQTISATSSDSKVATVKASSNSVTITGKAKGSCTITITAKDGGGATAKISVRVSAASTPTTTTTGQPKSNTNSNTNNNNSNTGVTNGKTNNTPTATKSKTAGMVSSLSPVITSSSSSAYVKKVQTALNGLGIKGKDGKKLTVDGKWGTNTDYAVKTFQKSSKWGGSITADGKIGPNTKAKFKKAGYYKGGIVDNVITNTDFLNMIRMNNDDGLITAKLGEGIVPRNMMPDFTKQLEQFNSIPADKIINSINNTTPSLNIQIDKFMDVQGNVDKNCVNDLRNLQNDITNNITKTLTQEFRKLGYK